MKITYKGKELEVQEPIKIEELLKKEIDNSKYKVVGCIFNNEYQNLEYEIKNDGKVDLIDTFSKEGMKIYVRTLVYIMGKAFEKIYPSEKLTVEYQLGNAMFCTIDNMKITEEFIEKMTEEIKKIISEDLKIKKVIMTREEAKEFYEKTNASKGRLQYDLTDNEEIYMYYCEDYYNYCYGTMANRTGVLENFEIIKYYDGFLLRYPSSQDVNVLPEYEETKKLSWALHEYETIYKVLNVGTVYRLNKRVKEGSIKELILLSEALHEKKIAQIADKIAQRKGVKMVLIAGPSSSGKTTFAQRLGLQLRINGIKPVTISVDNYFVERDQTPRNEKGEYDFEDINAIDIDLFNDQLLKLLNGEEVELPEFDFKVGTKRYNGNKVKMAEDEVLVIEGIHCLNDKLTEKIPQEQKYKIYISALTVLNMDSFNRISTTDTRLVRRIVRDNQFRGYTAQNTIATWDNVNKGEEKNIFPFQEEADSIFNTSLIYELGVLRNEAIPLLEKITKDEKEYAEAQRLIEILRYFEPISKDIVPSHSLLKEFLGGGDFKG